VLVVRDACPGCGSMQCKNNGHIHNGKQNHQGKTCGRHGVVSADEPGWLAGAGPGPLANARKPETLHPPLASVEV
jgi:hypothetical protein